MSALSGTGVLIKEKPIALCLLVLMHFCVPVTHAAEQPTEPDANPWQWLEGRRDQVSRNVTALGRNLDAWLAGEGVGDQSNESYLRIRINQQLGSFDGYHSRVKIGGSLDLPRASERWKLIFDSDDQELNSLGDNVLGDETSGQSVAGFSYQQKAGDSWQLSHTIGLRDRVPADPFYRFKAQRELRINDDWSVGLRQKIWHYKSQGWGYDTDVAFDREIAPGKVLRFASEVKYQQQREQTEFSQSIALHTTLAQYETISYELGILGTSKPNVRIDDYYAGTRYRRAVRSDWLFLEVLPQLVVSRDENWRPQPRLILNLEVLFFDL